MKRRHLFDNGYPVASATLLAGSEVLLAIASQAQRQSTLKLASSLMLLADSSERVMSSLARYGCTHAELAKSRDNYPYRAYPGQPSKRDSPLEPRDRPARAQPHQR